MTRKVCLSFKASADIFIKEAITRRHYVIIIYILL